MKFSFIRELFYGTDDPAKKSSAMMGREKSSMQLRRSSRLRERQSKNQHGQI